MKVRCPKCHSDDVRHRVQRTVDKHFVIDAAGNVRDGDVVNTNRHYEEHLDYYCSHCGWDCHSPKELHNDQTAARIHLDDNTEVDWDIEGQSLVTNVGQNTFSLTKCASGGFDGEIQLYLGATIQTQFNSSDWLRVSELFLEWIQSEMTDLVRVADAFVRFDPSFESRHHDKTIMWFDTILEARSACTALEEAGVDHCGPNRLTGEVTWEVTIKEAS